jgi:HlyD family secretion protein
VPGFSRKEEWPRPGRDASPKIQQKNPHEKKNKSHDPQHTLIFGRFQKKLDSEGQFSILIDRSPTLFLPSAGTRGAPMRKTKPLLILLVIALSGAMISYLFLFRRENSGRNTISVSGNIEVTTVDVAFKISGKIERLLVEESDSVKGNQLIAILEHRDLLAQQSKARAALEAAQSRIPVLQKNIRLQDRATGDAISQAQAAVSSAQARLQLLVTGSRPQEIEAAQAEVDRARAEMENRQADRDRAQRLFQQNYIAAQEWDGARTAFEIAAANYEKARKNYSLVREGPRAEEIAQARAQLEQSRASLKLAEAQRIQLEVLQQELATAHAQVREAASVLEGIQIQIGYSHLLSPTAGIVLVKNVEPGEFVVPGAAVITLGDLETPWLKAFIDETDLGRINLGQKVAVKTDSYPQKTYPGTITFISSEAEFTPKNVQTTKERVKLVYRIKVSLKNPRNELKPGMPADGQIHLNQD